MRIARARISGEERIVAATPNGYADVTQCWPEHISTRRRPFHSFEMPLSDVLQDASKALARGDGAPVHSDAMQFLAPIARPGKIMCLGLNYPAHAAEGGFTPPDYPTIFMRATSSLTPHQGALKLPACSDKFDFEGELAVIIGRPAYRVREEDALDYVAGYSIFNDGTIRDYQKRTSQWGIGKNFDATGGFGPFLVTPDELPSGASGLALTTHLNDQLMQLGSTSDMIFSVARTIEILTECLTLESGDVIAMGTPEGVGYVRTPPVVMREGDRCVVTIEGIGELVNVVERRTD
jgi:acylpyruvate hydrolase